MVNMGVVTTLGSETAATEPQSEQTLYICIGFACRHQPCTPHEELKWLPVTDVHARVPETPSNNNFGVLISPAEQKVDSNCLR